MGDNGKPTSGPIFDEMRRTKRRYHYAVRDIRKREQTLRNTKMAEAVLDRKDSNMWKEFKKASKSSSKPSNIDGLFNDDEIVDSFATKNRNLYNSVPSDVNAKRDIFEHVTSKISDNDATFNSFTVDGVLAAVRDMKPGKSDGDLGLSSDHVKNAPHVFNVHLCLLYNAMLVHGHVPTMMLKGTITHIPKDAKAKQSDSNNYRGICLCICFI